MDTVIRLVVAGALMGIMDFIWLGFIAKKLYQAEIGELLLPKPNMPAALLFYAIYVVGVVIFVVNPAMDGHSWTYALVSGALFGLVAYATYDLTNLATLKGFSRKLVMIDLLWGMLITSVVAVGTYTICSSFQ